MSAIDTPDVELHVTGMTCASCSARVQRHLNKLDGVDANVNLATETASIAFTGNGRVLASDLIGVVERSGYEATVLDEAAPDGESHDDSAMNLIVAAVLGSPVIVLSMAPALQFPYWQWLAFALSTPVVWWAGRSFHVRAWKSLKLGEASMDTLISIGSIAAWAYSAAALLALGAGGAHERMQMSLTRVGDHPVYFEVASGVVLLILLGRFLEARARRRAGDAVHSLLTMQVRDARVDRGGSEQLVPIAQVAVGDRVSIRAGEQVPVDGRVIEGSSSIDASLVTGESAPRSTKAGDEVIGGTLNISGRLVVETLRVGGATMLAQIARRVRDAQAGKAQIQRIADRVSAVFVPIVVVVAIATLGYWIGTGDGFATAFGIAVSVLIVACPCAMGLATPVALMAGTGRGARAGVLIGGAEVLESTRRITTVVFDKTGTVTEGRMQLADIVAADGQDPDAQLAIAAALEAHSNHPIATAIVEAAARQDLTSAAGSLTDIQEIAGRGITGRLDGATHFVASLGYLREQQTALPDASETTIADGEAAGSTVVAVGSGNEVRALFVIADQPRASSARAVARLRKLGLRVMMLTGDRRATAHAIAAQLGIADADVVAEVLPTGKADAIAELQRAGAVVAMVGDGINDAPALAQANLGISMDTGSDIAIQASDITLVGSRIGLVPDAIRLSRATLRIIQGNLFWAFAYNVLALPLAASGHLNPLIAAAAMAFSSLFVVLNSLRLRAFRFEEES